MTTNNHPITPPPELVQQWLGEYFGCTVSGELSDSECYLATQAARWGADQELDACAKWLSMSCWSEPAKDIRAARRPKPPSLKERLSKAIIDGDEKEALKLLEQLDD